MQAISQCPSHVLLGQSFTNCQHQTCTSGLPSVIYTSGVQPTASFLEWVPISQWVEYWLLKRPPVLSRTAFAQAPLLWVTYNPWLGDTKKKVLAPLFQEGAICEALFLLQGIPWGPAKAEHQRWHFSFLPVPSTPPPHCFSFCVSEGHSFNASLPPSPVQILLVGSLAWGN